MQPTPGPWFLFANGHCVGGPLGDTTAGVAMCSMARRDFDECMANAQLVAAAPDLLAVCKAVLDRHSYQGDGRPWPELFEQARAAIARAEGKETP